MAKRFDGVVGRTFEDSQAWWPPVERAPDGAPNVIFFVLDDVGYGQLSCFGGLVDDDDRFVEQGSNVGRLTPSDVEYDPISGIPRMSNIAVAISPG